MVDDALGAVLLSQLPYVQLRVSAQASLSGDACDDPATLEWRACAVLHLDGEQEEDGLLLDCADAALSRTDMPDGVELTIARMNGLTLDLWRIRSAYDSLDARSSDYEHFAPLFDRSGDLGLHPDLEECLTGGARAVIIERARLAPAWRGCGGVGRLLLARLLRWTAADAAVVATHPYPIDIPMAQRDDVARVAREKQRVQRTWQSLGFEAFREDLWVMRPHLREHGDTVVALEQRFEAYLH